MIHIIRHHGVRLFAVIVAIEAFAVMIGWIFNIQPLIHFALVGTHMRFITAVLFLLSAVGLYYVSRAIQDEDEVALVVLPGIAMATFVITFTLLLGRVLGVSTGIENLFVPLTDPVDLSISLSTAGFPSLLTILNFILFAFVSSIAVFAGTIRERAVVYAGCVIAAVGAVAAIGYLFNIPILYYQIAHSAVAAVPMSLNTAIVFIFLGVGLALIRKPESLQ